MARALNKLSNIECKAASGKKRFSDGGGLYLHVGPTGGKSWVFVWIREGRKREMGLGAYPAISLAAARELAVDCRKIIGAGGDPIERRKKGAEPTFGKCADMFLLSMESQWKNAKHRAQWRMTLDRYAEPIRGLKVSQVYTDDVLGVLKPLWQSRPETASRLRGRIERVLDFAKARGWRSGENPALWRGHLKNILPARSKLTRGHHAAMPYAKVPNFVQRLVEKEAISARALEFLILTAARSGEVLDATWDEFDLEKALWTIPASRMKAGKGHRVPLSPRSLEIVSTLSEVRIANYVFPGHRPNRPLSNMAFAKLMQRMKVSDYTPHGFRSSFRDWAGDATSFSREVAEQALAHRVGDETERAYRRADALEKRRDLMTSWANYCCMSETKNVVRMAPAS